MKRLSITLGRKAAVAAAIVAGAFALCAPFAERHAKSEGKETKPADLSRGSLKIGFELPSIDLTKLDKTSSNVPIKLSGCGAKLISITSNGIAFRNEDGSVVNVKFREKFIVFNPSSRDEYGGVRFISSVYIAGKFKADEMVYTVADIFDTDTISSKEFSELLKVLKPGCSHVFPAPKVEPKKQERAPEEGKGEAT